MVEHNSKAL